MGITQKIDILGQQFELHPSGAAYWEDEGLLLIADLHLGKVAHFRKHGAAVPADLALENYKRLNEVIRYFNPTRLTFMGDLFHSSMNTDWDHFANWKLSQRLEIDLIFGNHDIISSHKFEELGIQLYEELNLKGILLTHHPTEVEDSFNIAGHIHPGVKLRGAGRQSMRLPCFFRSERYMILPAFGIFTGKHTLKPGPKDQVYAMAEGQVIELNHPKKS